MHIQRIVPAILLESNFISLSGLGQTTLGRGVTLLPLLMPMKRNLAYQFESALWESLRGNEMQTTLQGESYTVVYFVTLVDKSSINLTGSRL